MFEIKQLLLPLLTLKRYTTCLRSVCLTTLLFGVYLQLLQEKVANVGDSNEMLMKVGRDIVDFHGEMVLLENYSALNYTGWCVMLLFFISLFIALLIGLLLLFINCISCPNMLQKMDVIVGHILMLNIIDYHLVYRCFFTIVFIFSKEKFEFIVKLHKQKTHSSLSQTPISFLPQDLWQRTFQTPHRAQPF